MKPKNMIVAGAASFALAATLVVSGCGQSGTSQSSGNDSTPTNTASDSAAGSANRATQKIEASSISTNATYDSSADGEHAIEASGETAEFANVKVIKTGEASGDEADFYGANAAVFATEGATLNLSDMVVTSNGTHANGVFSYGSGTTVNISHSVINTTGNCSGGLMTTGGGTMNATDVTAETTGNSSAAIRSDRGGGNVTVTGGYFTTAGKGSPVVYSTANITVSQAYMQSTSSQGVVVEGKNSVALNDCQLYACNVSKNSDKSDTYQAVMIYQSMSGDASVGESSFEMNGGSLQNENGDIFFVNNTSSTIKLNGASIVNNDASGLFLRAAAAGWGTTGSNGGKVNLRAEAQVINGSMLVDSVSTLNAYLSKGSTFTGAINSSGQAGNVYVEIDSSSSWTLTGDSYVSGLTCEKGSINLNGYKLYVNGQEYDGGSSTGTAFETVSGTSGQSGNQGDKPTPPDGNGGGQGGSSGGPGSGGQGGASGGPGSAGQGGDPGSGNGSGNGGTPPAKPDGQ